MTEEEVIEGLKECENCPYYDDIESCCCEIDHRFKETILYIIQKQQKEIEKKDKIIDEMAYEISEEDENFMALHIKEIKQYFEKKVEDKQC